MNRRIRSEITRRQREAARAVIAAIEERYPKIGHLTGRDFTGTMIDKLADGMYLARWGETVKQTLKKPRKWRR